MKFMKKCEEPLYNFLSILMEILYHFFVIFWKTREELWGKYAIIVLQLSHTSVNVYICTTSPHSQPTESLDECLRPECKPYITFGRFCGPKIFTLCLWFHRSYTPLPNLMPGGQRVMVCKIFKDTDCQTSAEVLQKGVQLMNDLILKLDSSVENIFIIDFENVSPSLIALGITIARRQLLLCTVRICGIPR